MTQHSDAQRVDQRVAVVGGVEEGLAADRRQTEAVSVVGDAGDDAGQYSGGVGTVEGPEGQGIHDADRASAHGHDVANDAADSGGCSLMGLDIGRMVVGLRLERDGQPIADVDDAGVVTDACQQRAERRALGQVAEAS